MPRHFPRLLTAEEQQPHLSEKASGRVELADWMASAKNPADGAGDGESALAVALWGGDRSDAE